MEYKGVPLAHLAIDEVYWSDRGEEHLKRAGRGKGGSDLAPEWVTEAVLDENRVMRLARKNRPGRESLVVIGYSRSAGALLKAWIWNDSPSTSSRWTGGSGCYANEQDAKKYEEG